MNPADAHTPSSLRSARVLLTDSFSDDRRAGKVIGSAASDGTPRGGADVEGVLSIDHGALRVRPLAKPGWARVGLAYGPYRRVPGLAIGALVLNGHNTSQAYELDRVARRIARWALGVPGVDSPVSRLLRWPIRMKRESIRRHVEVWMKSRKRGGGGGAPLQADNLAVGFFAEEAPSQVGGGNALVMHAASHENGELRSVVHGRAMSLSRNIQNLPILYVAVLRERGAVYYAASIPGAHALGEHPAMRPVGIDSIGDEPQVWAGVHQAVMGEIGFSVDTRVRGVRVAELPAWGSWCGGAFAADRLRGTGPLEGSEAEGGGLWRSQVGSFQRTAEGCRAIAMGSLALLETPGPVGVAHVLVRTGGSGSIGLAWRVRDAKNLWLATVGPRGWEVRVCVHGEWSSVRAGETPTLGAAGEWSLQVVDDGRAFHAAVNGENLVPTPIEDDRLGGAGGIGIFAGEPDGGVRFLNVEAHPRAVAIPPELDFGITVLERGGEVVAQDEFAGPAGDLAGREMPLGKRDWQRELGRGVVELTGQGAARVRATVAQPNPGRTAYTVPWEHPDFAELEATITPPGTARGQGENGRAGLIFWQDARNYILVNLWLFDDFEGASISSFFYLNGHEDLFDAVWTNVGARITWGKPYRLAVGFNGLDYLARVNDEPVLSRSLLDVYPGAKRLAINRIGICVNWEFQDDTGSVFHRFTARRRAGLVGGGAA